jgi:hypothetical protein
MLSYPSAFQGFADAAARAVSDARGQAVSAPTSDPLLDVKGMNAKMSGSVIQLLDGTY